MKLIVFNNPERFYNLLEIDSAFEKKFGVNNAKSGLTYYTEEVIYISDNGSFEFGDYQKEKLNSASISIFKDEFINKDILADLENDFCILRHTTSPSLISELEMLPNLKKVFKQEEEINVNYSSKVLFYQLAIFIGNARSVKYDSFYKEFIEPLIYEKDINDILKRHEGLGKKKKLS